MVQRLKLMAVSEEREGADLYLYPYSADLSWRRGEDMGEAWSLHYYGELCGIRYGMETGD